MTVIFKFKPMTKRDIPLFLKWAEKDHVKSVWFFGDYEKPDYIYEKVKGNGFDYPFIILSDHIPIGYIQYCDLYAFRTLAKDLKGVFTNEPPGSYCMDLFIGEEAYLNRGFGTHIVRQFSDWLLDEKQAHRVLIDPSVENIRAIRCYEKAGFSPLRKDHDGTCEVLILEKNHEK